MEEVEKTARKKGRAYLCLRCLHRANKEYIDVKYRMEAHIIRDHLRRDEVPFYCSLCQFRCTKEEELREHVVRYRRHRMVAVTSQVDPDDITCLKRNPEPYVIGPRDHHVMEKEESYKHWKTSILRRQANMECEPDSLAKVTAEVFPKELIGSKQNEMPSPRNSQTQNLQTLPPTMVSLSRVELQQANPLCCSN